MKWLTVVTLNNMKSKKSKLQSQADVLWYNKLIKDNCELCGENWALQVHHFYYKGSYGHLRYDLENGITLCKMCHFALHAGGDPKKITSKRRNSRVRIGRRTTRRAGLERRSGAMGKRSPQPDFRSQRRARIAGWERDYRAIRLAWRWALPSLLHRYD